jgi:hypothetical protein
MTKKDYIKFAYIIRGALDAVRAVPCPEDNLCQRFAVQFADLFKKDNARFNRNTFLKACGVKTDVGQ